MPTPTARDASWFEDLYRAHHPAVPAYARRRVADPDDVVAEVFAAWRSRDRVPTPPLPWLYRTASNHVLHVHRSQGRRDRLRVRAAQHASASADPADEIAARLDVS